MAVPNPPRSPQYATPPSPQERQRFFQTTDEDAEEMSIEDYVYRRDSFRSTSAQTKFPLPLDEKRASQAHAALCEGGTTFRKHLTDILTQHGIEIASCNFINQAKPGYPNGGNDWALTLLLTVYGATRASTNQWSPARRSVKAFIDDSSATTAEVEIIDLEQAFQPSIFPIAPDDGHIRTYNICRHSILDHVHQKIGHSWSSICLYKMGRNLQLSKYAVVISVLPFTLYDWNQLSIELLGIVTLHKEPDQIFEIVLVPGTCDVGAPPEDPEEPSAGISLMNRLTRYPEVGCSIGVAGKLSSATLGGFATLSRGDKEYSGFMTNSHVVEPADCVPENLREEFYRRGVEDTTPADSTKRAALQFPSTTDFQKTSNDLNAAIKEITVDISADKYTMAEKQEMGMKTGREKQSIADAQSYLDQYSTELKVSEELPEPLGRTCWASGRAFSHRGNMIDVAVVEWESQELKDHAAKGNKLPSGSDIRFKGQTPDDYKENFDTNGGLNRISPTICGVTNIKKGEWYFKVGRTTGLTAGVCHGTEAFVQIHDTSHFTRTRWTADGKPGRYETLQYASEYVIITSKFNNPKTSQTPFNSAGDNGSLLINRFGDVAGLLFGSICNRCGPPSNETNYSANAGLATTMSCIQEHLKHTAPGMTINFTNTVGEDSESGRCLDRAM